MGQRGARKDWTNNTVEAHFIPHLGRIRFSAMLTEVKGSSVEHTSVSHICM
jgi:hypothetical protein